MPFLNVQLNCQYFHTQNGFTRYLDYNVHMEWTSKPETGIKRQIANVLKIKHADFQLTIIL
jgi:hypothetical protein